MPEWGQHGLQLSQRTVRCGRGSWELRQHAAGRAVGHIFPACLCFVMQFARQSETAAVCSWPTSTGQFNRRLQGKAAP